MSQKEPIRGSQPKISQYKMSVILFAPLRLEEQLNQRRERVIKAHAQNRDHFTEISITENRNSGGLVIDYLVNASSPQSARRVGSVYLSQLCDLLSAVTQCPVRFFTNDDEAREERGRSFRQPMRVDRTLTYEEWSWVTGSLAALRREHPRFLAAASWFRKGLIGSDCLDDLCCFWRVIERVAESYADKSNWAEGDGGVLKSVLQVTRDLFDESSVPQLLRDEGRIRRVKTLRNNISHGNEPISIDMIDAASQELDSLQEAAYAILSRIREKKLKFHE